MAYFYTDPEREADPQALPDVEVFEQPWAEHRLGQPDWFEGVGFYYGFGLPGCLWDSEPSGPFDTEAEALADARSVAGLCRHGVPEFSACYECPAPELWVLQLNAGSWLSFNPNHFSGYGFTSEYADSAAWGSEGQALAAVSDVIKRMGHVGYRLEPVRLSDDMARLLGLSADELADARSVAGVES